MLFAAEAPDSEKDDSGKPALATFEPIAFIVNGDLRECYSNGPDAVEKAVQKSVTARLERAYTNGSRYTLWSHGVPSGKAIAVSACFDEESDFNGCFRFQGSSPSTPVPLGFRGIAISGKVPSPTHAALHAIPNQDERETFLRLVVQGFAQHRVRVNSSQVLIKNIVKTELRDVHSALLGNVLVQVPTKKPREYNVYRLFSESRRTAGSIRLYFPHFTRRLSRSNRGIWHQDRQTNSTRRIKRISRPSLIVFLCSLASATL